MVLVEEAEHEGEVVNHQGTDPLQLVADGRDGGHAATGLARLGRIHGREGLYQDLDAGWLACPRRTSHDHSCLREKKQVVNNQFVNITVHK